MAHEPGSTPRGCVTPLLRRIPKTLTSYLHPLDTPLKLRPHIRRAVMMDTAVAGQHPLKLVIKQLLHRFDLLGPRVPARVAKSNQRVAVWRPGQMITREEEFVLVKHHRMTSRVARNRNQSQVLVKINCVTATNNAFDAETLGTIVRMHDTFARIAFGKATMI